MLKNSSRSLFKAIQDDNRADQKTLIHRGHAGPDRADWKKTICGEMAAVDNDYRIDGNVLNLTAYFSQELYVHEVSMFFTRVVCKL